MTPEQIEAPEAPKVVRIRLHDFKLNARRLLPANHPLLAILKTVPDELPYDAALEGRLRDWLTLIETGA